MSDTKRDAAADLAVCAAMSATPWRHLLDMEPTDPGIYSGSGCVCHVQCYGSIHTIKLTGEEFSHDDARGIVLCVNALPHWIERATAAEAEVERLCAALAVAAQPCPLNVVYGKGGAS